jgi:hypothetical protein
MLPVVLVLPAAAGTAMIAPAVILGAVTVGVLGTAYQVSRRWRSPIPPVAPVPAAAEAVTVSAVASGALTAEAAEPSTAAKLLAVKKALAELKDSGVSTTAEGSAAARAAMAEAVQAVRAELNALETLHLGQAASVSSDNPLSAASAGWVNAGKEAEPMLGTLCPSGPTPGPAVFALEPGSHAQIARLRELLPYALATYSGQADPPGRLFMPSQPADGALPPGIKVFTKPAQRLLVVAIVGTERWGDWVGNLTCGLGGAAAHRGFFTTARSLATRPFLGLLRSAMRGPGQWSLVCVGHSRGGAVAGLLAKRLRDIHLAQLCDDGQPSPMVHSVSFGAPPFVSVAEATALGEQPEGFIMPLHQSIVNAGDPVPLSNPTFFHQWLQTAVSLIPSPLPGNSRAAVTHVLHCLGPAPTFVAPNVIFVGQEQPPPDETDTSRLRRYIRNLFFCGEGHSLETYAALMRGVDLSSSRQTSVAARTAFVLWKVVDCGFELMPYIKAISDLRELVQFLERAAPDASLPILDSLVWIFELLLERIPAGVCSSILALLSQLVALLPYCYNAAAFILQTLRTLHSQLRSFGVNPASVLLQARSRIIAVLRFQQRIVIAPHQHLL